MGKYGRGVERVYGVGVEVVLKWGKVCGDVREPPHSFTLFPTPSALTRHFFPHSLNTSSPHPHTHLTRLSTLSHAHFPSHFPTTPFHTPFLHLPQHFPTLTPHTSSQPPRLFQHFPMLPILYHLPHAKISHFSHLLPN